MKDGAVPVRQRLYCQHLVRRFIGRRPDLAQACQYGFVLSLCRLASDKRVFLPLGFKWRD